MTWQDAIPRTCRWLATKSKQHDLPLYIVEGGHHSPCFAANTKFTTHHTWISFSVFESKLDVASSIIRIGGSAKMSINQGVKPEILKKHKCKHEQLLFKIVLAMATLCFSPPLSRNPLCPTIVSYPSGNPRIKSWMRASVTKKTVTVQQQQNKHVTEVAKEWYLWQRCEQRNHLHSPRHREQAQKQYYIWLLRWTEWYPT